MGGPEQYKKAEKTETLLPVFSLDIGLLLLLNGNIGPLLLSLLAFRLELVPSALLVLRPQDAE